jgi:hypothetical protein
MAAPFFPRTVCPNAIDHSVMAITSAEAVDRRCSLSDAPELSGKIDGEIMIAALAFAVVAVALGMPTLIMGTMSARI